MFNLSKKDFKKIDSILVFTLLALVVFGLVVLSSALTPLNRTIKSQLFATTVGIFLILFIFLLDLDFLRKIKWVFYALSVGLIGLTIVKGVGGEEWGANLWLRIGPINLQPSEISKVFQIIFLSSYIGENKNKVNSWKFIISYIILGAIPVGLIILQNDLGTALVLAFVTVAMLFVSGISWKNILKLLAIFTVILLISLPFIWNKLEGYAKNRILDFRDGSRNLEVSTHQTDRGLIALGSGLLTGRGYKQGPFTQNSYIPAQETDFIFPVLVEDFGFIGGASLIILYGIMLWRLYVIALNADELYHTSFVIGVFALLFIHIFENVGMTMKLMPVTGIPLPFVSSGGTFQMINLTLMGIILSISMQRKGLDF